MTDRLKTVYPPKTSFCRGYSKDVKMLTESQSHGMTDRLKTVYPLKLRFAGGIKNRYTPAYPSFAI